MRIQLALLLLLLAVGKSGKAQVWDNLQNLQVTFKIKNVGITIDGKFTDVSAKAKVDQKNFSNYKFSGVIQATSVNTDNTMRDNHLRNKSEFFDVAKFPTITMKAIKVGSVQTGGSYKVDWLLTMKGVTKKITTDVLVNQNGNSLYVLTVFQLKRQDWNLGGKSVMMSDDVVVAVSGNFLR